ncbi:TPA: hypothetical protein I7704_22795 [Vibrio vulnificus]|nr:hypothetical protein [Vibrio vulnificus]HAS8196735.1 hypothetical protein [Vibrio vulnificus]HAS8367237.1 hypothetical protein [Vibrio vulnificus]
MIVTGKKSLLDAIGQYCDELNFQEGNKHRIGALLSLKDLCSYYEASHFYSDVKSVGYPEVEVQISSFFSHIKSICEQSLMFFICSEVSNSVEVRPFAALLKQLIDERYYDGTISVQGENRKLTKESVDDSLTSLNDLFVNRYDSTVSAHIFDFQISMFSAFECWISKLCESFDQEMQEVFLESRHKKFDKLLTKYAHAVKTRNLEECVELRNRNIARLKKIPGGFISFPDKFNFILKKIEPCQYSRNMAEDKALVDFLRAARNSVHNGGVHRGKDMSYTHKGITYELKNNQGMYHNDYNDLIYLCSALVDIYESILSVLKTDVRDELVRTINVKSTSSHFEL